VRELSRYYYQKSVLADHHYALYELDDPKQAEAATAPDRIKPLIADFDRVWGDRVSRRREILEIVQEMAG
jgi:hypothetical protein